MTMRLSRLPHDPAAVAAAPSLATHHYAVMAPPDRLARSGAAFAPQLRNNDTLPVCTSVGLLNGALGIEALNTDGDLAIAEGSNCRSAPAVSGARRPRRRSTRPTARRCGMCCAGRAGAALTLAPRRRCQRTCSHSDNGPCWPR